MAAPGAGTTGPGVREGAEVNQGLVLLGAWAEMLAILALLAYVILRGRS